MLKVFLGSIKKVSIFLRFSKVLINYEYKDQRKYRIKFINLFSKYCILKLTETEVEILRDSSNISIDSAQSKVTFPERR